MGGVGPPPPLPYPILDGGYLSHLAISETAELCLGVVEEEPRVYDKG